MLVSESTMGRDMPASDPDTELVTFYWVLGEDMGRCAPAAPVLVSTQRQWQIGGIAPADGDRKGVYCRCVYAATGCATTVADYHTERAVPLAPGFGV
jgi:hypothetical protein